MENWILTTAEVSKLIQRSPRQVKRLGLSGKLASMMVGSNRQRLFLLSDVQRFLRERSEKKNRKSQGKRTQLNEA